MPKPIRLDVAIAVLALIAIIISSCNLFYITDIEKRIAAIEATMAPSTENYIKIGVEGPMTGPNALCGMWISNGVKMRVDEINAEGGLLVAGKRYPIELFFADDESKVEKGVTAMEQLCTVYKVHAIVGAYHSSITVADCDIPQRYGVPFIDSGAMSIKIAEKIRDTPLPLVFQLSKTVVTEGTSVAECLVDLKLAPNNEVALVMEDSDYGRGDAEYFKKWLAEHSPEVKVVVEEYIPGGETVDWLPILTKIKESGATWVGTTLTGKPVASFYEAFSEYGLKDKIKLMDFGGEVYQQISNADWNLVTYTLGASLLPPAKFKQSEWAQRFKEKFGYSPADHEAQAYDAMTAIAWAIQQAGTFTDGEAIAKALETINIDGVVGKIAFAPLEQGHVRIGIRHSIVQYMPLNASNVFPCVWPEENKDQDLVWPPP